MRIFHNLLRENVFREYNSSMGKFRAYTISAAVFVAVLVYQGCTSGGFSTTQAEMASASGEADLGISPPPSSMMTPTPTPTPNSSPMPTATPNTSIGSNRGIMWGVNGHPYGGVLSGGPYADINQQMKLLNSLGAKHYRVDFYGVDDLEMNLMTKLLAAAKPYGILVTPVLIMSPSYFKTEKEAYDSAVSFGKTWATAFQGQIPAYELQNEINAYIMDPRGDIDGSNAAVWQKSANYPVVRGLFRGLLDGIHAGDPASKGALGDAGGCNYGMVEALWADGVRWDITVIHPYDFWGYPTDLSIVWYNGAKQGGCAGGNDMLAKHAQFGKPLWLTELNYTPGVNSNSKSEMGTGLTTLMLPAFVKLAKQYQIESVDLYELMDEPAAAGAESQFGIFTSTGAATAASKALTDYFSKNPSVIYSH